MKRRTPQERYQDNIRKQERRLEEFSEQETEWAKNLMWWYGHKKREMPDDEYRACAFFLNKEYLHKPGSLTLLYETKLRGCEELPPVTKENAFDVLCFQFRLYAKVLQTGGYS